MQCCSLKSPDDNQQGLVRVLLASAACLAWMSVSSLLILLNRYILVELNFPYPMAVSGMGMCASSVFSFTVCRVFKWVEIKQAIGYRFYLTRIMPIGLLMALTLFTGNQVYLYLTVSFIQMLKAFTPVITMVALFLVGLEKPTHNLIASVLLVALGVLIAAYGELRLSWLGLLFMFVSEATEAARLVLTQFVLVGYKFHPVEGLMYTAPACTFWLLIGSVLIEWPTISAEGHWSLVVPNSTTFIAAACMGFAVNTLAYTVIKVASSLTLKVLGMVKTTVLVVCGVMFFQEIVTGLQWFGYLVNTVGFSWYTHIKMNQIATQHS